MDSLQTDIMLVYTERCYKTAMRRELKHLAAALDVAEQNKERPHDYPPLASFDDAIYGDIRESRGRVNELRTRYKGITERYIRQGKYVKMLTHRLREKHGDVAVEQLNGMIRELDAVVDVYNRLKSQLQVKWLRYGVSLVQQCVAGWKKNPSLITNPDMDYIKQLTLKIERLVSSSQGYRSDIKAIRSLFMDGKIDDEEICSLAERIATAYEGDETLATNKQAIRKHVALYRQTVEKLKQHTLLTLGD